MGTTHRDVNQTLNLKSQIGFVFVFVLVWGVAKSSVRTSNKIGSNCNAFYLIRMQTLVMPFLTVHAQ